MNEYTKQVLHLTRMAMLPGWEDYYKRRFKELRESSEMFRGIGPDLQAEIDRQRKEQANEVS